MSRFFSCLTKILFTSENLKDNNKFLLTFHSLYENGKRLILEKDILAHLSKLLEDRVLYPLLPLPVYFWKKSYLSNLSVSNRLYKSAVAAQCRVWTKSVSIPPLHARPLSPPVQPAASYQAMSVVAIEQDISNIYPSIHHKVLSCFSTDYHNEKKHSRHRHNNGCNLSGP